MPASELGSNIRAVAYELKETDKKTAAGVRRAIRVALAEQAKGTTEAIQAAAGAQGLEQAKNATSFKVSFSVRSGGASVKTDRKKAPYARALEQGSEDSGGEYNRHPVFGSKTSGGRGAAARYRNSNSWVDQPTRPYFFSTAEALDGYNEAVLSAVVDDALIAAGWKGVIRKDAQKAVVEKYKATRSYQAKARKRRIAVQKGIHRGFGQARGLRSGFHL